jgi:tetratricopeptide (TPR) repeat protein
MSGYFDLGEYSRPVSTRSAEAQTWFDRGLVWTYAFNHEEAVACFRKALDADPQLAIAWWGVAYALGPNYNKPWEAFDAADLGSTVDQVFAASAEATEHAGHADDVEAALIEAIRARYPAAQPAEDLDVWNDAYARAMADVYRRFPDDLDVAALYADALMNLTPWALWDVFTGEPAEGAATVTIKEVLDRALALPGGQDHPGLVHLYIHLMEMSGAPEAALPIADRLRGMVPDGGHLEHMPTHLDVLTGEYRRVITSNTDAIKADARYVDHAGVMNFYTLYRCHNLHFRLYGALFLGASAIAFETADLIEQSIPEELLRIQSPPMADWLESFGAMRVHVLIRFGRWKDILDLALPKITSCTARPPRCCTTPGASPARSPAPMIRPRPNSGSSPKRLPGFRRPAPCSTTPARTSCRSPARCWKARSPTDQVTWTAAWRRYAARSISMIICPTTSPGAGCSRPGMRTAPCCWNRVASRKPSPSTAPTSGSIRRCPAHNTIRKTSGHCTAITNA